uniref:Uncharacterized protein n=1 Tax=Rhizophora mucronata TaxID=61149 RepID=A0A2P2QC55_RHIMU
MLLCLLISEFLVLIPRFHPSG